MRAVWIFITFVFAPLILTGQNHEKSKELHDISQKFEVQFQLARSNALKVADSSGWLIRNEYEDGRIVELIGFRDGLPEYYTTWNAQGSSLINSDHAYLGGVMGLSLTGSGQTLGIWDAGKVRKTHQEFNTTGITRVVQKDGASTLCNHATHVAGTMIGGGFTPEARGMSFEAQLDAYDWNNDNAEMALAAADGLQVSQHSYGYITGWSYGDFSGVNAWHWFGDVTVSETEDYKFGFYDNTSRAWDVISHHAPHYLIVKSAGNDRGRGPAPGTGHYYISQGSWTFSTASRQHDGGDDGYDCISRNSISKNILSVGAVNANGNMSSFSGWGPTDDGRIKPDIVAKGVSVYSSLATADNAYGTYSGTSMSGPMVSGSIGLILEHHQNLNLGDPLLSSTIKALIIHSADDMIGGYPGPDYRHGWGLMNTAGAVDILSKNHHNDGIHVLEMVLENNAEIVIPVRAEGGEPLQATIVWTDVPGTPVPPSLNPTDLMLVNDLDMRLNDSEDKLYKPFVLDPSEPSLAATSGDNFRDNVEMIRVENPSADELYEIHISHKGNLNGDSQAFSLIVTGNAPIECLPDWQVVSNLQYNMQLIGHIFIEDEISMNPDHIVGAFVDGECRGMASPLTEFDGLVFLSIASNQLEGEDVQLSLWNGTDCIACETNIAFDFDNLSQQGSVDNPVMIECGESGLSIEFDEGYNWFSINIDPGNMAINELFADYPACDNDMIIGQTNFATFFDGTWTGSLQELSARERYIMKSCGQQQFTIYGWPSEAEAIDLQPGFNWIGYVPQTCLPVNIALAGMEPSPSEHDRIIGQYGFAMFYNGEWTGSLDQLCPGEGYILQVSQEGVLLFNGN